MSIEEKVISIVSEVLGIESEKITSADTFDDLYADSLDLVEVKRSLVILLQMIKFRI